MKTAINHFRVWVIRMGFNQKQITAAANTIGIQSSATASLTFNGKRELTLTERLAMSARRAGLQPWTPDYDAELTEASPVRHDASAV